MCATNDSVLHMHPRDGSSNRSRSGKRCSSGGASEFSRQFRARVYAHADLADNCIDRHRRTVPTLVIRHSSLALLCISSSHSISRAVELVLTNCRGLLTYLRRVYCCKVVLIYHTHDCRANERSSECYESCQLLQPLPVPRFLFGRERSGLESVCRRQLRAVR